MSSKRERESERRRQEKFEQRIADKEQSRHGARRRNAVVAVLVAAVAVVGVVVATALSGTGGDEVAADPATAFAEDPTAGTAAPQDPATGGAEPAPTQDPASQDADNPCPPGPGPVQPVQVDEQPPPAEGPVTMTITTTCGDVVVELDGDAAPQAVGSTVGLARAGFYDGTPCHRLTTSGIFVLQCGDPTATGTGGPGYRYGPVENAPADDVYPAGTIAMARAGNDPQSMGSQFFIVYEDSVIPSDGAGGYTVMGQVVEGLDIVQQVAEGGLAPDGVAPARSIGIVSIDVEESA
ncbi:peptidylprolyl isomerase [Aquipuribacter sp. SD81]|uniref:peptidylprolyl isomerase n=1 Tax=Aquipuribacter sp. SD81 TaxID=3127703 RepID=UPI003019FE41